MFLTIQLHLTCRKDLLQEKKNEDLFRRTSDDSSKTNNNTTSAVTSLMQNLPATKKGKISSRRMMSGVVSRPEENFIVPSCSKWKHRGIQSKIRSMRLLTKRRHSL